MNHSLVTARAVTSAALLLYSVTVLAAFESWLFPKDFATAGTLSAAQERAASAGRAVILYYTRTNCPPCDALQAVLQKQPVGAVYRDAYVFTAVWGSSMGAAEREDYRARYGVSGAPTIIVFTSAGRYVCSSRGGFRDADGATALHTAIQARLTALGAEPVPQPTSCN